MNVDGFIMCTSCDFNTFSCYRVLFFFDEILFFSKLQLRTDKLWPCVIIQMLSRSLTSEKITQYKHFVSRDKILTLLVGLMFWFTM